MVLFFLFGKLVLMDRQILLFIPNPLHSLAMVVLSRFFLLNGDNIMWQ